MIFPAYAKDDRKIILITFCRFPHRILIDGRM